jgi:chemotaxis protein methyltransferase CheR
VTTAAAPPPPAALALVAELVEAHSGLRFGDGRHAELAAKVTAAFVESDCPSWEEYLRGLSSPDGAPAVEKLLEALVVGETYFFRHGSYFDMLERDVLPGLVSRRQSGRSIRLWSAGCATGEEAYSLAILLRRVVPVADRWRVEILATDLSRAFLQRAEAGLYREWSFRGTDQQFKDANFTREGIDYRIRAELRDMVRFRRINLAEAGYPSAADGTANLDLILCRNVLLHLDPAVAARIIPRFAAALVLGGHLVLGPSDLPPGPVNGFELRAGTDAFLYRRVEVAAAPASPRAPVPAAPPVAVPALAKSSTRRPDAASTEEEWLAHWRAAREHADRGELDQACARCRDASSKAPLRPEPYYLLGTLLHLADDERAATTALRQSLYVDPSFAPAHLALAAIHRRAGRPDEARRVLMRGQRALADRPSGQLFMAGDTTTVGRLRDALALALAAEREPTH